MKRDFPGQTPQQLHSAVQNTIRVFNEYSLDKKSPVDGLFIVHSTEALSLYYQLQYFNIDGGTQLSVKAGKGPGVDLNSDLAGPMIEGFLDRLDQVNTGKIVLTPDVVNRDVYKSGQTASGIVWLLRALAAAAAIILGVMALSR